MLSERTVLLPFVTCREINMADIFHDGEGRTGFWWGNRLENWV